MARQVSGWKVLQSRFINSNPHTHDQHIQQPKQQQQRRRQQQASREDELVGNAGPEVLWGLVVLGGAVLQAVRAVQAGGTSKTQQSW
jgi:hypothetical protein